MNRLYTRFKIFYANLSSRIAFYPSVISFLGAVFGFFMLYLEKEGISASLIKNTPALVINDASTARTLMSTFVGGIISIMVFSFSMVMLLLNQASNSYSPRILPGLISNKRNQIILGFYIGTIIYNVLILLSIEPTDSKYQLPGFAILIGIILGILILPAFIYFINSISQAIQINNITYNIYTTTTTRLSNLIEKEKVILGKEKFEETGNWIPYSINRSGYISAIAFDSLLEIAIQNDAHFKLLQTKGTYILKNTPFIKCNKELSQENIENVRSCLGFSRNEIVSSNYVLGFKQLTEIALKAMSPGINDPGTAITCLDYLSELFVLRMQKRDESYILDEEKDAKIKLKILNFKELLFHIYAALRQYCKSDFIMMSKLLVSLEVLLRSVGDNISYIKLLEKQVNLILEDAEEEIKNSEDIERLRAIANRILAH